MSTPILYGPSFSYFLRSMRLLFNYKGIDHNISVAPYGKPIPAFAEEHQKLHPFKKIPVLIEGDLVLPETIAIAWYIENKPGPSFMAGDAEQQAKMLSMASLISQYVHKAIMTNLILEIRFPKGQDSAIRFDIVDAELATAKKILQWLQQELGKRNYIVGEQFSLADAYLIPMLDYLSLMPAPYNIGNDFADLKRYLKFQRAQDYSQGVLGNPD